MKLLFTGDADSVHLQRWVAEMARRGARCTVLTRRPAVVPGADEVLAIRPGNDAAGWLNAIPTVRAAVRARSPDIVHGHYITSNGLWAAAGGHHPVVLTAWGSDLLVTPRQSRVKRLLTGWILRQADMLTGDSADLLAAMDGYGATAARHEITWGADCERFVPPPAAADPTRSARLGLVSLRAWAPNYRIDTLLDAVAALRRHAPALPVSLHLLGGGPDEAALRERASSLGLSRPEEEVVHFIGRQDDAGMVAALQAAAVSVTVPESDATSVSLLESMACGCVIVASDLPANRQWVDARGGALVPAGNVAALADALRALWQRRGEWPAMARHNRGQVLARASRRVVMDRMAALYAELQSSWPSRARGRHG